MSHSPGAAPISFRTCSRLGFKMSLLRCLPVSSALKRACPASLSLPPLFNGYSRREWAVGSPLLRDGLLIGAVADGEPSQRGRPKYGRFENGRTCHGHAER